MQFTALFFVALTVLSSADAFRTPTDIASGFISKFKKAIANRDGIEEFVANSFVLSQCSGSIYADDFKATLMNLPEDSPISIEIKSAYLQAEVNIQIETTVSGLLDLSEAVFFIGPQASGDWKLLFIRQMIC